MNAPVFLAISLARWNGDLPPRGSRVSNGRDDLHGLGRLVGRSGAGVLWICWGDEGEFRRMCARFDLLAARGAR